MSWIKKVFRKKENTCCEVKIQEFQPQNNSCCNIKIKEAKEAEQLSK
ncbi:hypothetical protein [Thermoflavimicrobium daqui]|jgi:hypothetical protein|nr:hypothetical protein [Thermoflavimicrobium daqui]